MKDRITLRLLATPQDIALDGSSVSAGAILEWIDRAGYACAVGWASTYCVTAYVGNVRFARAIEPGCLVEIDAQIIQTGRTSMQVRVTVRSSAVTTRQYERAIDCLLVFVALDANKEPAKVQPWAPSDESELILQKRANERVSVRRAIRDAMLSQGYSERGTTPRSKLRFMASPSDANWGGNAHGGTVMRWIHDAAYSAATSWAGGLARAIYSGGIHFLQPIKIGSLVEVEARIIHVEGNRMHVATRVSSAPADAPDKLTLTTVCMSVYIVPDTSGVARYIPAVEARSDEDIRLRDHASQIIQLRQQLKDVPL